MRRLCDRRDRYAAQLFLVVCGAAAGCPCCSFYRGIVAGVIVSAVIVAAFHFPI